MSDTTQQLVWDDSAIEQRAEQCINEIAESDFDTAPTWVENALKEMRDDLTKHLHTALAERDEARRLWRIADANWTGALAELDALRQELAEIETRFNEAADDVADIINDEYSW